MIESRMKCSLDFKLNIMKTKVDKVGKLKYFCPFSGQGFKKKREMFDHFVQEFPEETKEMCLYLMSQFLRGNKKERKTKVN